jgi:hypothetical protein
MLYKFHDKREIKGNDSFKSDISSHYNYRTYSSSVSDPDPDLDRPVDPYPDPGGQI